jgi:hypothetical protein
MLENENINEPQNPAFLVGAIMGSAFEPVHCQKDYEADTVTVQFAGIFDDVKAWEYLKQSYPSFEGRDIVAFSEPSKFRGLENMGEAVFKHYT